MEEEEPDEIDSNSDTEVDLDRDPTIDFLKDEVSGLDLFEDQLEELDDTTEIQLEEHGEDRETGSSNSSAVEKILEIARNLPENVTLGRRLREFVGTISEADCISLLKMLSKEGLVRECLDLIEWMRVQDPVLVNSRAFLVIFEALGRARMSEEIMVLVRNLPQEKRFRDVRVYNSAILGLAKCGR